jgi:long-chain fatty acid transport protein
MTGQIRTARPALSRGGAHVLAGAATLALLSTIAPSADAAGLYFSDRGVRPLARGGAFVAGADDIGAIWYNPAGLADAGSSLMADFSWLHFTSGYTRQTLVQDAAGTNRTYVSPTVSGTTPVLPIPTLGGSFAFGEHKEFTLAAGIYAPYTAIASYPLTVNGAPSPSRYSLVSLDGSALVVTGLWFAWKPIEQVRIGIGAEALVGNFDSQVVFSACPQDRLICAAEDPNYDALSKLTVGPIAAPSGNGGVTFVPDPHLRIAFSGQLPFIVDAPAKIDVRLPNAVEFDHAQQVGNDAQVHFELPAIFRAGLEFRDDLGKSGAFRVEGSYVREFWTTHHSIDLTPKNISINGVTGFPPSFAVSPISIPRNFENANSYRVGGEYAIPVKDYVIDLRLGVAYEQSAVPAAYLSPLTIDLNKFTLGLGGGLHVGKHWRLDAVYAHVFASDVTVDPAEAAVPRVNPVKGNPTATEPVNGGTYSARADILGVGVNYKF